MVAQNLSMIILISKVMKKLGFLSVKKTEKNEDKISASKKSTSKFSFLARETITINIGFMESADKNH